MQSRQRNEGPADLFREIGSALELALKEIGSGLKQALQLGIPHELRRADGGYELDLAVPGVQREEIRITVEGDRLVAEVERAVGAASYGHSTVARERRSGLLRTEVTLPLEVDRERVRAKLENGILRVHLPRPEASRHTIPIESEEVEHGG